MISKCSLGSVRIIDVMSVKQITCLIDWKCAKQQSGDSIASSVSINNNTLENTA